MRECMADTKKATVYAMIQKPHRNICSTTAWLTLAEGSVRSISPRISLQHLEGARHARHKRLPRKRRDVELLGRPAFARGSLKGIGKAGFKRRQIFLHRLIDATHPGQFHVVDRRARNMSLKPRTNARQVGNDRTASR